MIVVAHVSDTHVDAGNRSQERTRRVMQYLDSLPGHLDAVLLTGDIADHGSEAEYETARSLLCARHPVFTCPGNHDDRRAYRRAFLRVAPDDTPINRAHLVGGSLFLMCDSTIPGEDGGYLADETLEWMDRELTRAGQKTPAFVCFHHPPVMLHLPYIDEIRQRGEDRLAAVVGEHPQIAAFLCGHAHTAAATEFAGRPALVAPGVVSTLVLPWEGDRIVDEDWPPAIAFHVFDDGRLTTHYRVVTAG